LVDRQEEKADSPSLYQSGLCNAGALLS
jgi:hypothetical protein